MATYLFRKDCIEGRVFDTDEEVKKALADGWVDAPGKTDLHSKPPADDEDEKPAKQKGK